MEITTKIFRNPFWGEAGYYDRRRVETQGSSRLRVDLVDAVQKHGVQHHQREDDIRRMKCVVKYVRKSVGYEQGVVNYIQMSECRFVGDHIN